MATKFQVFTGSVWGAEQTVEFARDAWTAALEAGQQIRFTEIDMDVFENLMFIREVGMEDVTSRAEIFPEGEAREGYIAYFGTNH